MLKAILTDTHNGVRNDNPLFLDWQDRFYSEVFWPKVDALGIKHIVHLGDFFDRRKYLNFQSFERVVKSFLNEVVSRGMKMDIILGNHDVVYKNTNSVNSLELMLKGFPGITVHTEPKVFGDGAVQYALIPWICEENKEQCMEFIQDTEVPVLMGHFDIQGFEMHRGQVSLHGMDRQVFSRFEKVYSGHFHHRSQNGNIHYLGANLEHTWADFDDPKGFHIFDDFDGAMEFVPTPFRIFEIVPYDDHDVSCFDELVYRSMQGLSDDDLENKIVKVVVKKKQNLKYFSDFIDFLISAGVADVAVVDAIFGEIAGDVIDETTSNVKNTLDIINECIQSSETDVDKTAISDTMREMYLEAQQLNEVELG